MTTTLAGTSYCRDCTRDHFPAGQPTTLMETRLSELAEAAAQVTESELFAFLAHVAESTEAFADDPYYEAVDAEARRRHAEGRADSIEYQMR